MHQPARWRFGKCSRGFLKEAFIDVDGASPAPTASVRRHRAVLQRNLGLCTADRQLGQHRKCCICQPSGNVASHSQSVAWIDRPLNWSTRWRSVTVRGDTDFTHTAQLDRGTNKARVSFWDSMRTRNWWIGRSAAASAWQRLARLPKYRILTEPRHKPFRYKEQIVVEKSLKIKSWWRRPRRN